MSTRRTTETPPDDGGVYFVLIGRAWMGRALGGYDGAAGATAGEEERVMNKRDVLQVVEGMPDEIDLDELIYRFYVIRKLERAEEDLRAGRTISHEEFVRRSNEWLK